MTIEELIPVGMVLFAFGAVIITVLYGRRNLRRFSLSMDNWDREREIERLTMIKKGYRRGDTPLFYDPDADLEAIQNGH